MAKSTKTEETKTTTDGEFYPEDARERNFAEARRTAAENHERDLSTRSIGATDADYTKQAEVTEAINPAATPTADPEATEIK